MQLIKMLFRVAIMGALITSAAMADTSAQSELLTIQGEVYKLTTISATLAEEGDDPDIGPYALQPASTDGLQVVQHVDSGTYEVLTGQLILSLDDMATLDAVLARHPIVLSQRFDHLNVVMVRLDPAADLISSLKGLMKEHAVVGIRPELFKRAPTLE